MLSENGRGDVVKGVLCLVASALGFALMGLCVRLCDDLGGAVSPFQKSFFRNLVALGAAGLLFCSRRRGGAVPPPGARGWGVLVLRAVLGTLGIFANYYAISHIPLADAMALNKTAPFFTVLFAWIFVGEKISVRRLLCIVGAFAGAICVIKPGHASCALLPASLGLFGGMAAGGAYACVRRLGLWRVDARIIVLFFSAFSCLASLPFVCCSPDPMNARQLLVLLGAGASAAIGQFGVTAAYRYAAPAHIAVWDYTNILFAALFGWLAFGQTPDAWSGLGFVLIVGMAFLLNARMRAHGEVR